jgi:hypothetical protein
MGDMGEYWKNLKPILKKENAENREKNIDKVICCYFANYPEKNQVDERFKREFMARSDRYVPQYKKKWFSDKTIRSQKLIKGIFSGNTDDYEITQSEIHRNPFDDDYIVTFRVQKIDTLHFVILEENETLVIDKIFEMILEQRDNFTNNFGYKPKNINIPKDLFAFIGNKLTQEFDINTFDTTKLTLYGMNIILRKYEVSELADNKATALLTIDKVVE